MKPHSEADQYLSRLAPETQAALKTLRTLVCQVVPEAV